MFLALALLLCSLSAAMAETRNFKYFSVDLPPEWEARENGARVMLVSPGQDCAITIVVSDSADMDSKLIAGEMSQILKGTEPEPSGASGAYSFSAEVGGVKSVTRVQSDEGKYLIFSVVGDKEGRAPEVEAIWESLNSRQRKLRKLFRK